MCPLQMIGSGKTVLMFRRTEIHFIVATLMSGLVLLTADTGPMKCIQVSTEV